MRRLFVLVLAVASLAAGSLSFAADPSRVFPEGQKPADARLKPQRNLNDKYHPWSPPTSKGEWEQQAQRLREQILVSNGLWPLPEKTPLNPVIHGKLDRGDYTVEKVFFASRPGHYVTGSLYRPKAGTGPFPGVLCPHGHWPNGRFYDAGDDGAKQQIDSGAEQFSSGAHSPLQARFVQLARMGCVVFHYDMVGYADSRIIDHRAEFNDVEAGLRLQNKMGLQTWNSIRALDFLCDLPDVDATRIGVTGASGGGTQTFILCGIDPRPAVAFPAVMVSTAMQGGCVCENAPYLRQGINNIAIAALCAPRPQAMSGADDWTIDIESKGLPELKQVYSLYDAADRVQAKTFARFPHNYNQPARELMFDWFNEYLRLDLTGPVKQSDFTLLTAAELAVFDAEHPQPADALAADRLRESLTAESDAQWAALLPTSPEGMDEYRRVVGTAARVMLTGELPVSTDLNGERTSREVVGEYAVVKGYCGRKEGGEQIPVVSIFSPLTFQGRVVLWMDGRGKQHLFGDDGQPNPAVARLVDQGFAVTSADVFLTGEYLAAGETTAYPVDANYPGYTFCYNRPLLSHRVRDILTVTAVIAARDDVTSLVLVGTGEAGPWTLLARAFVPDKVENTLADLGGFEFARVHDVADPMLLPGALKYGDIGGLAALAAPAPINLYGCADPAARSLAPLRQIANVFESPLHTTSDRLTADAVAEALLTAP